VAKPLAVVNKSKSYRNRDLCLEKKKFHIQSFNEVFWNYNFCMQSMLFLNRIIGSVHEKTHKNVNLSVDVLFLSC
jgi:hypothetical protein